MSSSGEKNRSHYAISSLRESLGQKRYQQAKELLPGGTQLLSKRPELFAPLVWPAYYSKAKGNKVWDLDGRSYIDMSVMAIGAAVLGYADDEVDKAVVNAIQSGIASSLNCPEEVELAELLIKIHPWAQMVRYTRGGGEAMSVAVRIARAATKRDVVLFNGYHGWTDWYLAANLAETSALDGQLMPGLEPLGIPRSLQGTTLPFFLNGLDQLRKTIQGREKKIAAIVIEPARGEDAPVNALKELRMIASEIGAVLVFDEITSGFRMNPGGIHLRYGVNPDVAVFAKSMANGYAMASIIGVESIMQAAQSTFISSTNWTERIGPTAAIATIKKYIRENVHEHLIEIGNSVKEVWKEKGGKYGLPIKISGLPSLASFSFESEHNQLWLTYVVVEMLQKGFLAFRQFKSSFAHRSEDVTLYADAMDDVFKNIANSAPASLLKTPVAKTGFSRLVKE